MDLRLTQKFIGEMLGVHRPTVTEIANEARGAGIDHRAAWSDPDLQRGGSGASRLRILHRRQGGVRPSARSSVSWATDERKRRFYSGAWHFPAAPRTTSKQQLSGQVRTRRPPQRPPIKNRGDRKCQPPADLMADDLCIPCFSLVGGSRNVPAHPKLRQVNGSEDELFQCDNCKAWWSIRKLGWGRLFRAADYDAGRTSLETP